MKQCISNGDLRTTINNKENWQLASLRDEVEIGGTTDSGDNFGEKSID